MTIDAHGIQAMLARRVGPGADAAAVGAQALVIWRDVDTALSPIIAQSGVAALYKRSLYPTRVDYPCLVSAYEERLRRGDFVDLDTALGVTVLMTSELEGLPVTKACSAVVPPAATARRTVRPPPLSTMAERMSASSPA